MIVECPSCHTNFPVDPKKVPPGGVHARCSVCEGVFFVAPPPPAAPEPTTPAEPPPTREPEAEVTAEESAAAAEPATVAAEPEEEGAGPSFAGEVATGVEEAAPDASAQTLAEEVVAEPGAPEEAGAGPEAAEAEAPQPFVPLFGKRDPMEKAERLARVLVSDIILYNPDRHQAALESGRLKEEFDEEIQKSWAEYVEQVGEEIANSTDFFSRALNDILAKGEQVF